jgi:hypothetical protein
MSALFEELKKQTRLLTAQEKAMLARILIEELDASTDSNVEQLWGAESQRVIRPISEVRLKPIPAMRS